ncbi:MAG: lycopene cyclase family protein [Saprospiraceae bacterium]
MKKYDYIIAGGGLAGLSLAFYINANPTLQSKKILIADKSDKIENDRTWCFWVDQPTAFDEIIIREWEKVHFFGVDYKKQTKLNPFKYKMIRGIDFYNFAKSALQKNPNIEWINGNIDNIQNVENGGQITIDHIDYQADWIFNSTFDIQQFQKKSDKYFYQLQHFKGWIIETEKDAFKPDEIHLMDFRTAQHNNARFFYVLPYNKRKALIEYTIFSDTLLAQEDYDVVLKQYIKETLGIENYTIEETEYGIIPMTNHPFKKAEGKHILNIGTIGGDVKSSTGYAFYNIQQVTQKIAKNLAEKNYPFYKVNLFDKRFSIYDTLILNILQYEGGLIKPIFTKLFKNNKIQTVFAFLNESTSLWQEIKIFYSLPHLPFWRSIFSVYFYKPIKNLFAK